ncbi:MAG TPA: rRNA maturation RNase YbeY [Gemmatimonadales bacterium]|nr:rRNA maturation RNase YbeY [Gemmatimonadales bacterium]
MARRVLAWEGADSTRIELTLLDAAAMRRLHRRAFGRRALTDVIAFALPQPDGTLRGDVYICPDAAARWAGAHTGALGRRDGVSEELVRLAVHGTLHVLGYDHPAGPGRLRSAMWRRQERYVRRLRRRRPGGR